MNIRTILKNNWLIILMVALATAIRVGIALQWDLNFNDDESVFGLMARDMLFRGKFPVYFYNQSYLGSIESFFTAGFLKLFGSTIFAMRIVPLLLMGLFFYLQGRLVQRLWGLKVACFSILVLAFPGWPMLWGTYRSIYNHPSMLVLGTIALFLCLPLVEDGRFNLARLAALGFVFGLGVWTQPLIIFIMLTMFLLFWFQSPEWCDLHRSILNSCQEKWKISANKIKITGFLAISSFTIIALFTKGWEPDYIFGKIRLIAIILLVIIGLIAVIKFLEISKRRRALVAGSATLAAGYLLGNLPSWWYWLFHGVAPAMPTTSSTLASFFFRFKLMALEVIPEYLGVPSLMKYDLTYETIWARPPLEIVYWFLVLAILLTLIGYFLWKRRKDIMKFATFTPVAGAERKYLFVLLLFLLPLVATLVNGKTDNVWAVRFLPFSWQAYSIVLALVLAIISSRSKIAVAFIVIVCIVLGGALTIRDYESNQGREKGDFSYKTIRELQDYLAQYKITGGFADNAFAYAFNYATEEKLTIVNYNFTRAKSENIEKVFLQPVQAYILFHSITKLPDQLSFSDFKAAMRNGVGDRPPAFEDVLANLENRVFVDRRRICHWDVWLVKNPSPSDSVKGI